MRRVDANYTNFHEFKNSKTQPWALYEPESA